MPVIDTFVLGGSNDREVHAMQHMFQELDETHSYTLNIDTESDQENKKK